MTVSVLVFTRDLRLADNPALAAAMRAPIVDHQDAIAAYRAQGALNGRAAPPTGGGKPGWASRPGT
jgi:hypothetical protein